jgi:hypothetical protein
VQQAETPVGLVLRKASAVLAALILVALLSVSSAAAATVSTAPQQAASPAAGQPPKIVIIVGATEATTSTYRSYADSEYAEAIKYTPNVVKVYSPFATWSEVQNAVNGASIVIYHGHGNGWPSPYTWDPNYTTRDGFGLNGAYNQGDYNRVYYGEPSVSTLQLAPNAIVMLHNLCYAAGSSEPGDPDPTLDVAKQRVDNYAAGFLRAGARAVLADGHSSAVAYLRRMFTTDETLLSMWRANPTYNGNEFQFGSSRTPGAVAAMDPEQPGAGFYRSLTGDLNARTTDITNPTTDPVTDPAKGATFVPVQPGRVLDTRFGTGLSGLFMTNQPRTFQVAGLAGVPVGAVAVAGNLTVTGTQSGGYLALGPRPLTDPPTSTINFPAGDTRANNVVVALGSGGTLSATFKGTANTGTHLIFDVTGYFKPDLTGATFKALAPGRVLDTRFGTGLSGSFQSGVPRTFGVAGKVGVPSTATAVAINVTITEPTAAGYVTVTPQPNGDPPTSTLNFKAGETKANGAIVPLGSDGSLSAVYVGYAGGASTPLIVDVTGYFIPGTGGATFVPISPSRVLDTRFGNGLSGPFAVNVPRTWQVVNRGSVPGNASAVTGNVTVVGQTWEGYVSVTPTPIVDPSTSTINFPNGDVRANGVAAQLGSGNLSAVYKSGVASSTHLIFDVTGYFLQP